MRPADWDERYRGAELLWSAEPNRFVAGELADLEPHGRRALDLACGEGRHAVWLAERGWAVDAVDFSPVALARGAELAAHRSVEVAWQQADVTQWQPSAAAYGLVLLAYLHVPAHELAGVLRRAAEAVAPGGVLLAVGHHADNLERGHGGPGDPALLWDPVQVAAELEGLAVDRAEEVQRPVSTEEGPRIALDALVHAHRP